jgi:antitoxin component of MazEF toxin-antitoxin module
MLLPDEDITKGLYMSIIINYNDIMGDMFKVKVRKIGTSLGVLLPKRMLEEQGIKEGEEVEIGILKKDKELLDKVFGITKGSKPFKREKTDRMGKLA